jgi:DNA-binding MurR/RpiR family transcriptional regulator
MLQYAVASLPIVWTLLKCAAGETGVSEALIVKIAKKLGFEGFRQLREALGEHNRVSQATLHEELSVAEGASRQS